MQDSKTADEETTLRTLQLSDNPPLRPVGGHSWCKSVLLASSVSQPCHFVFKACTLRSISNTAASFPRWDLLQASSMSTDTAAALATTSLLQAAPTLCTELASPCLGLGAVADTRLGCTTHTSS